MAIKYTLFQFPELPGIHCFFQGRSPVAGGKLAGNISFSVGDSPAAVLANRMELYRILQARGMAAWAECNQVHGDTLLMDPKATRPDTVPANLPQADGLCSAMPGLGLVIKTADCQPVLLAHKSGKYIMALHVGWRGNRIAFPVSAIKQFCDLFQIGACDLLAVRGPSLGPARSEFANFASEWGMEYAEWYSPRDHCVNLWSLTRWQLVKAGLIERNIYELDICTRLNDETYFSYRADKNTGRQANIIWMDKAQELFSDSFQRRIS